MQSSLQFNHLNRNRDEKSADCRILWAAEWIFVKQLMLKAKIRKKFMYCNIGQKKYEITLKMFYHYDSEIFSQAKSPASLIRILVTYKTSNTISESLGSNCDIAFRVETCPTGYLFWTGQTILLLLKKVGTFYKLLSKLIELHCLPKNYYCCSQYPPLP